MTPFSDEVMRVLREMDALVDLDKHHDDVQRMFNNNRRRSGGRTPEMVLEHTQRGYGAEIALQETGLFQPAAAIVEDADEELTFADRMRDLTCEGRVVSVKTTKDSYRYFYVTETQFRSILHTRDHCNLLLVMSSRAEGAALWRYKPKFLIDNRAAADFISYPSTPTPWRSRVFRAEEAVAAGACVDLTKEAVSGEV